MSYEIPKNIAMIMDGNRRWAKKRGLPTQLGHSEGAKTMQNIAEYCEKIGVKYMTVYAFSTENWKRTKDEVDYLMKLLEKYIKEFDKKIRNFSINCKRIDYLKRRDQKDGVIGFWLQDKSKVEIDRSS